MASSHRVTAASVPAASVRAASPRTARFPVASALIAAGLTATVLAGCSDAESAAAPTAALETVQTADVDAVHNPTDVAFAQSMLVMHRQEGELAAMALERSDDRGVRSLAVEATEAGTDDQRLVTLLTAWGSALPGGMEGAPDPDPSASAGPLPADGLIGADRMADLVHASDEAFDRLLLDLLAQHHQDGVDLAMVELDSGSNPQALELAARLRDSHLASLEQVQELRAEG